MATNSTFKAQLKHIIIGFSLFCSPIVYSTEIIPVGQLSSQATSVLGSFAIPKKQVSLTAQIPGRVLTLNGDVGTPFKKGDVIAEIDSAALLAKRNQVASQIMAAQANLYNAQVQYQREMKSPRRDDISAMPGFGFPAMMDQYVTRPMSDMMGSTDSDASKRADLVSSQTAVSQANSSLQQAMAQLQQIDSSLRDAKTIAPFDGIILKKMAEVGDTLQPGQGLVSLGYVSAMQLQADVPEGLVAGLKKGIEVTAKITGLDPVKATIAEIEPVADVKHHTVVVKFDLPKGTKINPGMYSEVMVPLSKHAEQRSVITIPKTALLTGRSLPSLLVMDGKSSVLRLVRLGAVQSNGQVEVLSGLNIDDKIIDNPPSGVGSGWIPLQKKL